MFNKKPMDETSGLEKTLDRLFADLSDRSVDSEEYSAVVDQVVKLYSLKEQDSKKRVSPDVKATIAANLLGIALIVGHERAHIVTSKALNFIMKLR